MENEKIITTEAIKIAFALHRVVRHLRIKLGLWNFEKQLKMNGVVECLCGGQIISNTGKVIINQDMRLKCWQCGKSYACNEVYYERKEGQRVVFR